MWIVVCATTPRPFDTYDYYAYIGIYGVCHFLLLPSEVLLTGSGIHFTSTTLSLP